MITNKSRKNRFLLLLVGLLAIPAFFLDQSFSPTPVIAPVLSGSGPPPTGDWVIDSDDTVIKDEQYLVNGSIVVTSGYNLTLTNVTLWMNGEFNITVNSGGELYLHNCTVTAYNTDYRWFLAAKTGSTLLFNETMLSYAGADPDKIYDGICISTDNAKVINCTMLANSYGLRLYQANDTLIKDTNFTNCRIHFEKANNTILESNSLTHSEIYTDTSYNTTIERNNITDIAWPGIWLKYSSNSTVRENTVTDTGSSDYAGIQLEESGQSTVSGNSVTNSDVENDYGIWLRNSSQSTVSGNTVTNSDVFGIQLEESGNSSVHGNNVTNAYAHGIYLTDSANSTVSGNNVTDSTGNGIFLGSSGRSSVSENTVTNCSNDDGIYLLNSDYSAISGNIVTDSDDDGIYLLNSGNSTICENNVTNSSEHGIELDESGNSTVSGNTVTNSDVFGIMLSYSSNSTVSGNRLTNSGNIDLYSSGYSIIRENTVTNSDYWGIRMSGSGYSIVSGNKLTNNGATGIQLGGSGHSTVSGNTITNSSQEGIWLGSSGYSTVSGNTVMGSGYVEVTPGTNLGYGISLDEFTSNCLLCGNHLAKNERKNSLDHNGSNQWDNGTHGNWYDDYTGPDLNQDGIGDIPYSIGGGLVEDRYPLMNLVLPDTSAPTLDSPADVTYTAGTTGRTITWQPSDANPYWYQILQNGSVIVNATWDGAVITLELDDLASGTYNFTIVVLDRLGYRTTDEVLVTVKPAEEETTTTEDESQLIPGFAFPLVGLSLAISWVLARSRKRKGKPGDSSKNRL